LKPCLFAYAAGVHFFLFWDEYKSHAGFLEDMILRCGTHMSMFIITLDLNVLTQFSQTGDEG
jgi:hypothetical protein